MFGKPDIVDMHCDTISVLRRKYTEGDTDESLRSNRGHVDLIRMKESGYLLQNMAMFVHMREGTDPWEDLNELYDVYQKELTANEDLIAPVLKYEDIEKNRDSGKMSSMLTVEEGGAFLGQPEKLKEMYDKGVRMITLTWNFPNELGYPNINSKRERAFMSGFPKYQNGKFSDDATMQEREEINDAVNNFLNTPDTENGLTPTGRVFVKEMERLGIIVDVSHLSDAGFWDVVKYAEKPFVASHSNARSVCPVNRNITDDMIRALAEKGGVMGLNYSSDFLIQLPCGEPNPGTIEDIVRHARHITDVGGMDVLGLGSDFDGIATHKELPGAQAMERLYDALLKGGYTSSQADKIFSGNVLRLYRDIL